MDLLLGAWGGWHRLRLLHEELREGCEFVAAQIDDQRLEKAEHEALGYRSCARDCMLWAEAVPAASALMRGSGDDLEACIALEARIFKERLAGARSQGSF